MLRMPTKKEVMGRKLRSMHWKYSSQGTQEFWAVILHYKVTREEKKDKVKLWFVILASEFHALGTFSSPVWPASESHISWVWGSLRLAGKHGTVATLFLTASSIRGSCHSASGNCCTEWKSLCSWTDIKGSKRNLQWQCKLVHCSQKDMSYSILFLVTHRLGFDMKKFLMIHIPYITSALKSNRLVPSPQHRCWFHDTWNEYIKIKGWAVVTDRLRYRLDLIICTPGRDSF